MRPIVGRIATKVVTLFGAAAKGHVDGTTLVSAEEAGEAAISGLKVPGERERPRAAFRRRRRRTLPRSQEEIEEGLGPVRPVTADVEVGPT